MRKNREQQKKRNKRQLELFDCRKNRPEESPTGGTGKGIHPGVELVSQLERRKYKLLETALVREYAGWCGRTAVLPLPTRLERENKKNNQNSVGVQY